MRTLTLDRAIGDQWLVTSGLDSGDQVIVEGLQRVRPGAKVTIAPLKSETGTGGSASTPANSGGK